MVSPALRGGELDGFGGDGGGGDERREQRGGDFRHDEFLLVRLRLVRNAGTPGRFALYNITGLRKKQPPALRRGESGVLKLPPQ